MAFQVADRYSAPAFGGADHGREHQLHRRVFVAESADDLGAAAFFDERAFGQVRGPYSDTVPDRDPVDRQQRIEVVPEAGNRSRERSIEGVDQPVRGGAGRV